MCKEIMRCRNTYYRVDRRQINYLRFILEAYDGIGVITTLDARKGAIVIKTAPGCEADVDGLVKALAQQIHIEPLGDEDDDALSRVFD